MQVIKYVFQPHGDARGHCAYKSLQHILVINKIIV